MPHHLAAGARAALAAVDGQGHGHGGEIAVAPARNFGADHVTSVGGAVGEDRGHGGQLIERKTALGHFDTGMHGGDRIGDLV